MKEEFEKLVAAGKLGKLHVDALVALTKSGFCVHRSWGFGRITSVDTVFARFVIDFPNRPGHTMDLGFAAESLKAIGKVDDEAGKNSINAGDSAEAPTAMDAKPTFREGDQRVHV